MSWIAEYDTQGREFPTCVHVTKTTGTMTHGATYVPIEDGRAVRAENVELRKERDALDHLTDVLNATNDGLISENAKLRELVRDFYPFASGRAANPWLSVRLERMRELGV